MRVVSNRGIAIIPEYSEGSVKLKMVDENDKEIESIEMDLESASLLTTLLEYGAISAENITKNFKKDGVMLRKIKDVGTCFAGNGNRISIAILPADEKRSASVLIGFHKGNKHSSIILKPKKVAYLSKILTKLIISNI
ncbi:MAG TPA: hypothetical protein EYG87_00860 [Methanothermococcus okinawensis]|uniref:Uncharacterized protein n=1 Tax=Methanofervidicoccus abyssi TaxID=2082189 RepID=A0A401HR85_9EURY|nr:hypothetical protein [Methanofervidicoccus abyssi]GBF36784.1 hypothetical protein MHHB_P1014 [Methanofervidicoccus abyssi]HIP16479.1 hypothetical protein [Methanothermococcus okinawensis]HIP34583.1 hypothetical protein [Methanothermococcus okinawensis]